MNDHLVFAASPEDAAKFMESAGLVFEETSWVMNVQLLGSGDFNHHTVHYTDLFKQTPAYREAVARFGAEEGAGRGV